LVETGPEAVGPSAPLGAITGALAAGARGAATGDDVEFNGVGGPCGDDVAFNGPVMGAAVLFDTVPGGADDLFVGTETGMVKGAGEGSIVLFDVGPNAGATIGANVELAKGDETGAAVALTGGNVLLAIGVEFGATVEFPSGE
jgi:hypothetical protein